MTTIVLKIPDKKENYFLSLFKKHHLKSRVLQEVEDEDLIAKWIDEANVNEEIPGEKVYQYLRKHGVKC